jgi:acyl carrier protein
LTLSKINSGKELQRIIRQYLSEYCSLEDKIIDSGEPVFTSGLLSSLELIDLLLFLEQKFTIKVDPIESEMSSFDNLDKITDFVSQKLSK